MQLRLEYTLSRPRSLVLTQFDVPAEIQLEGARLATIIDFDARAWHMSITTPIDTASLEVAADSGWFRRDDNGQEIPIPAVDVADPAVATTRVLARSIASALTFLVDCPVDLSVRPHDDELVAESDEDERLLASWGTRRPLQHSSVSVRGGSVSGRVGGDDLLAVLPQQAGLRLYEEALRADTPTARFRDLWRVLESAFTSTDDELIELLAQFQPVCAIGVSTGELRELLIIRGRASHAQSKAGIREVVAAEQLCRANLPPLKDVVERVLETKENWGYPTLGYGERLQPGRRVSVTERPVEAVNAVEDST